MGKLKFSKKFIALFSIIVLLSFIIQSNRILFYPSNIKIVKGENKSLDITFPFSLSTDKEKDDVIEASANNTENISFKKTYSLNGIGTGKAEIQIKFLGLIPIKNYNVDVIDRPELIPGGNAIGVRLNTKGVLVVAVTDLIGVDNERYSPARDAGIKVGDSILEIDGIKVNDAEHVVKILNEVKDKKVKILVQRNKAEFITEATPVQCIQDNSYRLGVWVRDKTSGIGTLTYLDKESGKFGALGHGIVDSDTGKLLSVDKGKIMNARISKIEQGKKGSPGEIRGVFYEANNIAGDITLNNSFGIFGTLRKEYLETIKNKPIPIGFKEEVKEGKAYIYTTVNDDKVEKFEVEILKVQPQVKPDQKSMVIKVTDEKLLELTGGIVQGMSGSPIIQDGKLIGAITHVFVNDPTKGYGIFIEWMLEYENNPR